MATRELATKPKWLAVLVFGMVAALCGGVRAEGITGIVFGDSLSDVGNDYVASNGTQPSPANEYSEVRFTNGGNWLDDLAKDLGVTAPMP
jgi:GDSL-like Lipase/Acylhydrolase